MKTRTVAVPNTEDEWEENTSRLPSQVASLVSAVSSWASNLAESWAKKCAPLFNPCSDDEDDDDVVIPKLLQKVEHGQNQEIPSCSLEEKETFRFELGETDTSDILDQMIADLKNTMASNSFEKRKKIANKYSSVSRRPSLSTIGESSQSVTDVKKTHGRRLAPPVGTPINSPSPMNVFESDSEVFEMKKSTISSSAECKSSSGYEEISTSSETLTSSVCYMRKSSNGRKVQRVDLTEKFSFLGDREWDAFLMSENEKEFDKFSTITITGSTVTKASPHERRFLPTESLKQKAEMNENESVISESTTPAEWKLETSVEGGKKQVDQLADDRVAWLLSKLLRGVDLPAKTQLGEEKGSSVEDPIGTDMLASRKAGRGLRARCDQDKFDYVWHRLFHDS